MSDANPPIQLESSKDYTVVKEIGEGSYGRALLARDNKTTELIVVKEISFKHLSEQEQNLAREETHILSLLNFPYIVGYRGSFMENNTFHILMEYADGGDLSQQIKEAKEHFPEKQVLKWFVQLCLALKHCHDRKILHRDLKAENIFLTKDGDVKLGDFGIAKVLDQTTSFAKTSIGTPFYLSPEICEGRPYNVKSDIWSLGCVLYELCALKKPFESNCINGLIIKIISKKPSPLPNCYSKNMQNLVEWLLKKKPTNRPTVNQILKKKFINDLIPEYLDTNEMNNEFCHTTFHGAKGGETPKNLNQGNRGNKTKSKLAVRKSGIPVRSKNQISKSISCSNTKSSSNTKEHSSSSARLAEKPNKETSSKPSTTSGIRPPSTPSRYSPSHQTSKLKTSSSPLNKPKMDPQVKSQDIIHLDTKNKPSKISNTNENNNVEEEYDENVGNTEDYIFEDDFISDDDDDDNENKNDDENSNFTFKGKPFEDDPSCPQEYKDSKLSNERNDIVRNFIIQNLGKQKFDKAYNLVAVESEMLDEDQVEERLNKILVSQKELDFYPLIQQLIVAESMEDSKLDYF